MSRQLSAGSLEKDPIANVDEQFEAEEEDELLAERSGSESELPEQKPIDLDVNLREFNKLLKLNREASSTSASAPSNAAGPQYRKKDGHTNSKDKPTTETSSTPKKSVGGVVAGSSSSPSPSPASEPKQTTSKPLPAHPTTSVELISAWRSLRNEPRSFYDYFIVRLFTLLLNL